MQTSLRLPNSEGLPCTYPPSRVISISSRCVSETPRFEGRKTPSLTGSLEAWRSCGCRRRNRTDAASRSRTRRTSRNRQGRPSPKSLSRRKRSRQILVREGADIDAAGDDGWTPLHYASRYGEVEIVKVTPNHPRCVLLNILNRQMLIREGADIEARRQSDGWTSLHLAVNFEHTDIVKVNPATVVTLLSRAIVR